MVSTMAFERNTPVMLDILAEILSSPVFRDQELLRTLIAQVSPPRTFYLRLSSFPFSRVLFSSAVSEFCECLVLL